MEFRTLVKEMHLNHDNVPLSPKQNVKKVVPDKPIEIPSNDVERLKDNNAGINELSPKQDDEEVTLESSVRSIRSA